MTTADPSHVARALERGPATLDALSTRLAARERAALTWAVEDAVARGWVQSSAAADCGPEGVCSTSAPALFSLTAAGRAAARRATG